MLNFCFVGPSKTGTDFLYTSIENLERYDLAKGKATFYYDRYYHKNSHWYANHFNNCGRLKGEVCHDYIISREALVRMQRESPDLKIIVTLRDPFERLVSSYFYSVQVGYRSSLKQFIEDHPFSLYESSYGSLLESIHSIFSDKNVLIINFGELKIPAKVLGRICSFIEGEPIEFDTVKDGYRNETKQPRSLIVSGAAKFIAKTLRHLGLGRLVHKAHKAYIVNTILFKRAEKVNYRNVAMDHLGKSQIETINFEIDKLEHVLNIDFSDWKLIQHA